MGDIVIDEKMYVEIFQNTAFNFIFIFRRGVFDTVGLFAFNRPLGRECLSGTDENFGKPLGWHW